MTPSPDFHPTLPASRIAYARKAEMILCDRHVVERLNELNVPHFDILGYDHQLPCCRCSEPGYVHAMPYYLTDPGDFES